ncbi:hypothetical protein [Streptosporangium amethystogenes]|uniref:hypothetical protein n=1 Tax=Streptosporangium amethystogenes TaxID=2002 RepID=UPI0012FB6958|nr:hypothetical protein [Streptosporangium amethystogenes]
MPAQAHGHSADAFVCLLIAVLATVWGVLRLGRNRRGAGMWIGALVLTAATLVADGLVLDAAALADT